MTVKKQSISTYEKVQFYSIHPGLPNISCLGGLSTREKSNYRLSSNGSGPGEYDTQAVKSRFHEQCVRVGPKYGDPYLFDHRRVSRSGGIFIRKNKMVYGAGYSGEPFR